VLAVLDECECDVVERASDRSRYRSARAHLGLERAAQQVQRLYMRTTRITYTGAGTYTGAAVTRIRIPAQQVQRLYANNMYNLRPTLLSKRLAYGPLYFASSRLQRLYANNKCRRELAK
jgi:hypothetical protein